MDQKTFWKDNEKNKVFKIPASWKMHGWAEIEASSEQEAINIANAAFFDDQPTLDRFDGHYTEESFQIDYDILQDH